MNQSPPLGVREQKFRHSPCLLDKFAVPCLTDNDKYETIWSEYWAFLYIEDVHHHSSWGKTDK